MKYVSKFLIVLMIGFVGCTQDSFRGVNNVDAPPDGNLTGGDGNRPAEIVLSIVDHDFGVQSVFSYNNQKFSLKNIGDEAATDLTITPLSGAFEWNLPSTVNFPCASVAGNTECDLTMTFHPTQVNEFKLGYVIRYMSAGVQKEIIASVKGMGSNVASLKIRNAAMTSSSDLGKIAVGVPIEQSFDVIYAGAFPATSVSFSVLAPFTLSTDPNKSTCATTVQANCKITVIYPSSSIGVVNTVLKVGYNNSAYADQDIHNIKVETVAGKVPAILSLNGGNAFSFGKRVINQKVTQAITVGYAGTLPAKIVGAAFSDFRFTVESMTCGAMFTANCTITIGFQPNALGSFSNTLSVKYEDGESTTLRTVNLAVTGTGANPAMLTISPASPYDFGNVSLRKKVSYTVTVTNAANSVDATMVSPGVYTPSGSAFTLTGSNPACSNPIAGGGNCKYVVSFQPTVTGSQTVSHNVTYFDGVANQSIARTISGTGVNDPEAAFTNTIYDFGNVVVGNSKASTFQLKVYGGVPISLGSPPDLIPPFSHTGGTFPGLPTGCNSPVSADCSFSVTFAPTALGTFTQVFTLNYKEVSGSVPKSISVTFRGVGVDAPATLTIDSVSPSSFGSQVVGSVTSKSIKIKKAGTSPAIRVSSTLSLPFRYAGGSFPGTGGSCAATINADCIIVVEFVPAGAGLVSQTLTISYNDGLTNRSAAIVVNGTGVSGASLALTSANAGRVKVGEFNDFVVNVTNTGNLSATNVAFGNLAAGPFTFVSTTCGATLASAASCVYRIKFTPVVPGPKAVTATVNYMDGIATSPVSRSLAVGGNGIIPIAQIAANGDHTCAITPEADVKCWGKNNYGQLGLGDTVYRGDANGSRAINVNLPVVNLDAPNKIQKIAVGYWHSCALTTDGDIKCWGWNNAGQLGVGIADASKRAIGDQSTELGAGIAQVNLGTGVKAVSMAAGYAHTCAITTDGKVKCWGHNTQGQLGLGDTMNRGMNASEMGDNLPYVDLGAGLTAKSISADTGHTCAVLSNDSLKCWGDNFYGQLGQGDFENRGDKPNQMGAALLPIELGAGRKVSAVSAGGAFTCAILDNGAVKCFGLNYNGNLGRSWCQNQNEEVGACTDPGYKFVLYGYGVKPGLMGDNLPPVDLGAGRRAMSIASGNFSTCVLLDNGAVKCWGDNEYGQLGYGDTTARGVTVGQMGNNLLGVDLGVSVRSISAGASHVCVVSTDEKIKCFGDNRFGALGQNDTNNRGDEPNEMGANLLPITWY